MKYAKITATYCHRINLNVGISIVNTFLVLPTQYVTSKKIKGATSTIQCHSAGGINTSVGKQIDIRATPPHPTTTIYPPKVRQQRAKAATAIGNAAASYKYVFVLTFISLLESTELRSARGWRRWIVQRAQPLYWRAPALAVEATYRGDSYAARTVSLTPAFFSTTILLTGQHFYFLSKFDRKS